jgi:heat-inducible transcriptional repressor
MERLDPRSETILKTIVREYISLGEPIGSRTVSRSKGVSLSPASVRNIMTDLTESGYIAQPHVSAGRVPTDKAYRFYVDDILALGIPEQPVEREAIYSIIQAVGLDRRDVFKKSSSLLAGLSRQAGVVSPTPARNSRFKSIQFIKVSDERILVILESSGGATQHKLILDEDGLNQDTLDTYSRIVSDLLQDLNLSEARDKLKRELELEKNRMDALMSKVMGVGYELLSNEDHRDLFIEGTANMLVEPEFLNVEHLKAVLITFEEKSNLLKILDKTMDAEGVQVYIGSELGLENMEPCAVVAYPIRVSGSVVGAIAVIGPKRMQYGKIVALVDTTAQALTRFIAKIVESPV